jgi:LacI family transcriptional regulator
VNDIKKVGVVPIDKNGKTIKMKDIATAVGVSTVTVSKALNDKDGVSEEMREIIKNKAKELGYVYNPIPRIMLNGKTNNVAILVSKKFLVRGYDVYFQIYETIIERLAQTGYFGILEVLSKQAEFDCELPRVLQESKVDGLILLGQISEPYLTMIANQHLPFVLLDFYGSYEDMDTIVADNFFGSYMVTSYLIKNGHKDIGFVGNYRATSSITDRYMGYLKGLIEHDLSRDTDKYLIKDRDDSGAPIALEIPDRLPTAFVCNNDEVANTLIHALSERGIHVPGDVSVVGFDNFEKIQNLTVGITTVEVDFITMATTSVDVIVRKIKRPDYKPGRQLIGCRLVVRDSVKTIRHA